MLQKSWQCLFVTLFASICTTVPDAHSHAIPPGVEPSPEMLERSRRDDAGTDGELPGDRLCLAGSAFHNETASCHKLLEQGPCGELQFFYSLRDNPEYGECACMANHDGCNDKVKFNRMLLPSPDTKQCMWAYSQGPCKAGEWYVLGTTLKPECQKNTCATKEYSANCDKKSGEILLVQPKIVTDSFTFTANDTCYSTFTQAFCPEGQYTQFVGTHNPNPKCFRVKAGPPNCLLASGTSAGLPCAAGFKLVGDDCVAIPSFE